MADAKNQRVLGVETERLFNLDFIIVEIADQRFAVVSGEADIGDAFGLLRLEQRKRFGLVEQRQQF